MARIETWFEQDVKKAVKVQYIDGNVFSMDNNGNRVGVVLFNDGVPEEITGDISASVIRSDGATVSVSGSSSGNRAWVNIPKSACFIPGVISIIIKEISGTRITTICAVVANVYLTSTDEVIDPGSVIPSLEAYADVVASAETAVSAIEGFSVYANQIDGDDYEIVITSEAGG